MSLRRRWSCGIVSRVSIDAVPVTGSAFPEPARVPRVVSKLLNEAHGSPSLLERERDGTVEQAEDERYGGADDTAKETGGVLTREQRFRRGLRFRP